VRCSRDWTEREPATNVRDQPAAGRRSSCPSRVVS
jgi:hypothetical protein